MHSNVFRWHSTFACGVTSDSMPHSASSRRISLWREIVLQRVFVAQVPHDNVSTMRWHSRNAMHQLRLHVYASVIIQRTLYTYMSLQYIESSLRLQLRGFRKLCRKGNWNVLTYRTMQACRYLFDASGVLFVIAADWKYRTIVYMQM